MHRGLRHLPNVVSGVRIALMLPIAWALLHHRLLISLGLFAVAGVSDGVDGFLARRFGWQSELGGVLDAVADKALLATVFVTLAILGSIPVWLTAVVLGRDIVIVAGAIAYRWVVGPVKARPSPISKFNTVCQIVFVVVVVASPPFGWRPWLSVASGALVFVTACISGIDYVCVYGRLAVAGTHKPRATA